MTIEVVEDPIAALADQARVSIAFEVRSVLRVAHGVDGRFVLTEHALAAPHLIDHDAMPGEGPLSWPGLFDVSRWGLLVARADGERVGGAVVAFDTPGVDMLEGRRDLACLWDIRVAPGWRRHGVGACLFRAAEDWARERGCSLLKIETQDVNVVACRFYESMGCELRVANPLAYPSQPDETQLLWYRVLAAVPTSGAPRPS